MRIYGMIVRQPAIESGVYKHLGAVLLSGYLALYGAMLLALHWAANFDPTEPLLVFAIVGVGFTAISWLSTARAERLPYPIADPYRELLTFATCLPLAIAFITWGLGPLHRYIPSATGSAFAVLAAKLIVLVVFPAAIMCKQFGYSWRQLVPMSARRRDLFAMLVMALLLFGFQALFGRGLKDIADAHISTTKLALGFPLTFLWLSLEAGVVEEFFFRVLLQTRLTAVLKSALGGIVLTSLTFGLAHAPGIYLRTALTQEGLQNPSVLMALGYSIVVISLTGFFLGVLWARTHNFVLVVVVHAMGDLLPNLLPTLRSLRLLS